MRNLLTRGVSALVYVAIFFSAILYSVDTYNVLIILFGLICLWEFSKLIQFKRLIPYAVLVFLGIYFSRFNNDKALLLLIILTLLASVRQLYFLFTGKSTAPESFFEKLDGSLRYVAFPFVLLMLLPIIQGVYMPYFIIYTLILMWTNDSFAFFVGKNLGKHKLLESISPKKTIEGFIGGIIFSLIAAYLISEHDTHFTLLNWLIISLIISIIGSLGDLVESKYKRQANVKDSGKIMPGHGGLLDRLDSLFFVAPFVFLYVHYLV